MSRFVGVLYAHDLRTPLTQVHLALSLLPNNGGDIKLMHNIQRYLDNINNLISDTLNIGKELTKEDKHPSNPLHELENVVANVIMSTQSKIVITNSSDTQCAPILYPMAFKRVLTNLLTNAVRYGQNKPVKIVLYCNDKQTTVQIKDSGIGIPKEFTEKVFQPFYRIEKSRNNKTGGSGIGLAIVQQLVNLHGWQINLKPLKNGGTNAILIIPNTKP